MPRRSPRKPVQRLFYIPRYPTSGPPILNAPAVKLEKHMKMQIIPKNTLVLLSSGEYSDYSVRGLFRAKEDIDPNLLKDEWCSEHPEQMAEFSFKEYEFIQFVESKGLIETVPSMEWYLGCYRKISEMRTYEGPMRFS